MTPESVCSLNIHVITVLLESWLFKIQNHITRLFQKYLANDFSLKMAREKTLVCRASQQQGIRKIKNIHLLYSTLRAS